MRLREHAPEVALAIEDRELPAGRIGEAIHEAGEHGCRKVEFTEALAITNGLVDELLAEKAAGGQSETPEDAESQRSNGVASDGASSAVDALGAVESRGDVGNAPSADASDPDRVAGPQARCDVNGADSTRKPAELSAQ